MTDSTPTPSENSQQPAPAAGGTPPATSVAATPPEKPAEPAKAPEPIKAEAPPPQPTPPPADVVPDAYELKAPEGQQFDAALLTSLAPTFKELGLTNAKAQKLADAFIKVQQTNHAK